MRRKIEKLKLKKVILPLFLSIFMLPFLVFFCYELSFKDKIYPGVKILDINLSNYTLQQAEKKISSKTKEQIPFLEFFSSDQTFEITLESLKFDPQKTAQLAYQVGRNKNFLENLKSKMLSFEKNTIIPLQYTIKEEELDNQISSLSEQVFIPTIEPTVNIEKGTITVDPGRAGRELNARNLKLLIDQKIKNLDQSQSQLPLIETSPIPTQEQIQKTQERAQELIGKSLDLKFEELSFNLDDNQLVQFISFTNGFDEDKIASVASSFSETINRNPENATFEFKKGKVVQFQAAKEGRQLDDKETVEIIVQALEELESNSYLKTEKQLPVLTTKPQITTADVNSFGIKELLAKGESYFYHSIASRIHNISLASSKLNGIIIPPGEVFSFNAALGDISSSTGYQQAYIIKDGRTILGDGGGVCQTSTTLFRAVLNAGLEIIERHAHAYRVSYYEQNSSVGLDATVFAPSTDLKFKNNTPAYILIQTEVDTPSSHLIYYLYGTKDNREVTISKSKIWDQVPPPPDLYQDDPTLPVGTIKQVDWKSWGAKVSFDYKVSKNGETLFQKTFYSNYKPWQAVFLKGTKG